MLNAKVPWKDFTLQVERSVEGVIDGLFSTLDGIEGEVKVLLDKDLQASRDKLADEIITSACNKTAMVGGGAAVPDMLPIGGWPVLAGSIATDFAMSLREDLSMLLKLAYLYGPDLSREERKREAIGLLASYRAPEGDKGSAATEVGMNMGLIGSKHLGRKALQKLLKELAERFLRKKLMAVIPFVGIAISSGVNYWSSRQLGEYAKRYYLSRKSSAGEASTIAGEILAFQRCYFNVIANMAKIDRVITREEEELLRDSMMMFSLPREEQERMMTDLKNVEALGAVSAEDLAALRDDDRRFIMKSALKMMHVDAKGAAKRPYRDVLSKRLELDPRIIEELEREARDELGVKTA